MIKFSTFQKCLFIKNCSKSKLTFFLNHVFNIKVRQNVWNVLCSVYFIPNLSLRLKYEPELGSLQPNITPQSHGTTLQGAVWFFHKFLNCTNVCILHIFSQQKKMFHPGNMQQNRSIFPLYYVIFHFILHWPKSFEMQKKNSHKLFKL